MLVRILGETEIGSFQAISDQYIEERDNGIYLCKICCDGGLRKKQGQRKIHDITQEAANDTGYTIPQSLTGQLFYSTQMIRFPDKCNRNTDKRRLQLLANSL